MTTCSPLVSYTKYEGAMVSSFHASCGNVTPLVSLSVGVEDTITGIHLSSLLYFQVLYVAKLRIEKVTLDPGNGDKPHVILTRHTKWLEAIAVPQEASKVRLSQSGRNNLG